MPIYIKRSWGFDDERSGVDQRTWMQLDSVGASACSRCSSWREVVGKLAAFVDPCLSSSYGLRRISSREDGGGSRSKMSSMARSHRRGPLARGRLANAAMRVRVIQPLGTCCCATSTATADGEDEASSAM